MRRFLMTSNSIAVVAFGALLATETVLGGIAVSLVGAALLVWSQRRAS